MRTRSALAAVLATAATTVGIAGFAGVASAGQGGPYGTGISILSVTPNPVAGGKTIHIEIQERTESGIFFAYKLTGPCIGDYEYDPSPYKFPKAFKGSFHADLVVSPGFAGTVGRNGGSKDDEDELERAVGKNSTTTTTKPSSNGAKDCKLTITGFPSSGAVSDSFIIKVLPGTNGGGGKKPDTKDDKKVVVEGGRSSGAEGNRSSGDTFEASVQAVRAEALPAQQAAIAVESSAIVVAAAPASVTGTETKVAGVSVTNSAVTLPRTGSSSMAQAWLGAMLAAVGAGFVLFARRRARHAYIRSRYLS